MGVLKNGVSTLTKSGVDSNILIAIDFVLMFGLIWLRNKLYTQHTIAVRALLEVIESRYLIL